MHLWQHYVFSDDLHYLEHTAFPVMKSACEFWFDRLETAPDGKLTAPDEWSPEQGPWEDGAAYAQQLIWELFNGTLKAASLVPDVDAAFVAELQSKFALLDNGVHIGSWGQIREWKNEEDLQGNTHRHLSHLIALYPGRQISGHSDTALTDAARKTLVSRGDGGTGWSRAWKIACWARLFDGNHAYKLLKAALEIDEHTSIVMENAGGVYENLFDSHPPFQIDGNFGAAAGIAEMLLQSHLGFIQILPALPSAWSGGNFSGLRAEGDFTIDASWENSGLVRATVYSGSDKTCKLYYPNISISKLDDENGNSISFETVNANMISFPAKAGGIYRIVCGGLFARE
jgi:alpha-L-fucosidase 2